MRKLVLLVFALVSFVSVQAQKDTTDIKTTITTNFPDNIAGFITPERLREVSLDLMRSNANKLEDNVMSGKLTVNDSVKTTDGFYRWTGTGWASVSDDTTAWARSGGFILPLDYTDKLSVNTARFDELIYPNDGTVNIGTRTVPFDTTHSNVISASSLVLQGCDSTNIGQVLANTGAGVACWTDPCCPLDNAYDSGGSGLGREIVADNGAVKVSGTDGLLVTGTFGSGAAAEISGSGTRMFFNPAKAAFRAGYIDGTQWNDGNIGNYSVAFGSSTTASNEFSFAFGEGATASGQGSVAFGESALASGDPSFAIGASSTASGANSFASGESSTASGETSTAMGSGSTASGANSTAFSGSTASGANSTAMGQSTNAKSFSEAAIGLFNTDYTPTSTTIWSATDRLLVVGNGQSTGTRSDALVMLKNGNTTLNGALSIVDGTQADGYTLTSDASGNASWQQTDAGTGWASYNDATFTGVSPLVILEGDTAKIPMFWESAITSQLPTGVDSLWNRADSTLIGFEGDAYIVRVNFNAESTSTTGAGELIFDIGNGTPIIITDRLFTFAKGANTEQPFSSSNLIFAGSTFETRGCAIKIFADTGDISLSDFNIVISRIHKAR